MKTATARTRPEGRTEEPRTRETRYSSVLERIRDDARREPRRWLRDAEVPGGGE